MKRKMICVWLAALMICSAGRMALADSVGTNPAASSNQSSGSVYKKVYIMVKTVPIYCFYSPFMKDYFWTTSEDEKKQLEEAYRTGQGTYEYQGIWDYAEQSAADWNMPVYRFWNKKTTDHFYTTSDAEKAQLEKDLKSGKDDYVYEGIAWYVPRLSNRPIYRFFDTVAFNHYYTSDEQTKDRLAQAFLNGTGTYRYEGIAWNGYE